MKPVVASVTLLGLLGLVGSLSFASPGATASAVSRGSTPAVSVASMPAGTSTFSAASAASMAASTSAFSAASTRSSASSSQLGMTVHQEVVKRGQGEGKVDGRGLYGTYCSNCHGGAGNGDGPAASTLNPKPQPFRAALKGKKDPQLLEVMANGRGQMPGWGQVLNDEQLRAILAHIKDLGR